MWAVLGFLLAAAIGLVTVLAAGHRRSAHLGSHPWIVYDTAKGHVGIMAGLAGFAFTGVVLIVTLHRAGVAESSLDTVIVMFLVAYLWWVGNAFLISYLPHGDLSGDLVPRVHFSLASTIEYRTVFLSWFALLPLLEANGLGRISHILYFLVPASLLFGSVLISMVAHGLGLLRVSETYLQRPSQRFSRSRTPASSHSQFPLLGPHSLCSGDENIGARFFWHPSSQPSDR
jgi:hypothetical protein